MAAAKTAKKSAKKSAAKKSAKKAPAKKAAKKSAAKKSAKKAPAKKASSRKVSNKDIGTTPKNRLPSAKRIKGPLTQKQQAQKTKARNNAKIRVTRYSAKISANMTKAGLNPNDAAARGKFINKIDKSLKGRKSYSKTLSKHAALSTSRE